MIAIVIEHLGSPDPAAARALADNLRSQIAERVKSQQQIVLLTATLVGIGLPFAGERDFHPIVHLLLAAVCFVLGLVVLRYDQEITVITSYLLHEGVFGSHSRVQAAWEEYKFEHMKIRTWWPHVLSVVPGVATYGIPIGAGVVYAVAALLAAWPIAGWKELAVTALALVILVIFVILFGRGLRAMIRGYKSIGTGRPSSVEGAA